MCIFCTYCPYKSPGGENRGGMLPCLSLVAVPDCRPQSGITPLLGS